MNGPSGPFFLRAGIDVAAMPQRPANPASQVPAAPMLRRCEGYHPAETRNTPWPPRSATGSPAGRKPPMNRLTAILPTSNVLVNVDATSKKRVFEQAGLLFETQHA